MKRLEKLNELLKEEISKIIAREVELVPGALLTITRAETSPDKISSRVYFSVLAASPGEEGEIIKELVRQTPGVQRFLNRKLRIRPVPKIQFMIDKEEQKRERVEKLLSEIGDNAKNT